MKTLKKYAYQSPETEILSLESGLVMLEPSPTGPTNPNTDNPSNPDLGEYGAPWRF